MIAENLTSTQLRQLIAERVRTAIHQNKIKPGEWLRQEQIAQRYGVSHTPVREALKDLAAEGLVDHVPYRGVRVVKYSIEDLKDLYACRAFVEALAARHAATNITPSELANLKHLFNELKRHPAKQNLDEYRRLNRMFHQAIYEASHRPYLIRILNQLWAANPTMMLSNFAKTASKPIPDRNVGVTQEHHAILASLEEHDAGKAEKLVRHHIEESAHKIVDRLG